MPKKVVGVISFMNRAGAQEALMRLMRQLRARGHDTEIWFLYRKSDCYRNEPGVRILIDKNRLYPQDLIRLFPKLVRLFRAHRPDAVVGFLPLGNVMGLTAAKIAGISSRIASQRSPGPTFGTIMRLLDRVSGARGTYKKIICVSRAVKDSFDSYPESYRSRLSVVHNGIEWVPSSMNKASARASFGIPENYPLLVATGRFDLQKNYDLMIRVIATTPRLRLAIAGEGPLRQAMEKLAHEFAAHDRIHFVNSLTRDRVADLLRAGDGFVQTSLFEGQSNSILEAMHEGLPIICSDIDMQRETLCEENGDAAAILVPLDNFEGWRSAFIRLRDEPEFMMDLGERAKALASRRFTLNRMIDGFETAIMTMETEQWTPAGEDCAVRGADFIH